MSEDVFKNNSFGRDVFQMKYAHEGCDTWDELADTLVKDVVKNHLPLDTRNEIARIIKKMQFIPGGRYLYYAGRPHHAWNNCYLLRAEEDTREDWAELSKKAELCLTNGGGIGVDYSVYRESGAKLTRTGGVASGPLSKALMINEIGRSVMQGGSRRSAIYGSLNWQHPDAAKWLNAKNWKDLKAGTSGLTYADLKEQDFNFPCPLDFTNISLNYDDAWLADKMNPMFVENCRQALKTGEPGFSFNFGYKQNETLRNAPVSADTWVMTSVGYRQIRDIVEEPVVVWTGKQFADTVFVRTKRNVETVVVNMSGGREIKADPEHEFLVERYTGKGKRRKLSRIDRVPADMLQVGDILHVSLPNSYSSFIAEAYTRGFLFGDGSVNKYGDAEVTICSETKKVCAKEFVGIRAATLGDSRGYDRYWFTREFSSKFSKIEIEEYFEHYASFIAGYFDADGSYDAKRGSVRLSSMNRNHLESVRRMLECIGIRSVISQQPVPSYGDKHCWSLLIVSSDVTDFSNKIPTKRLKIESKQSYRASTTKVISVTNGPVEDVYCCDVGVEEHSFVAEGVVISNCTEVTSADDSDVCNLGSINMANVETLDEFGDVVRLATAFLMCGTLGADLPYERVYKTREKNRRLGLGLMGVHEWLLQRGYKYEMVPELQRWMQEYEYGSDTWSATLADRLNCSRPVANRAIAPTGTIGILAGTTTGIEPLFCVAYKRRYLKNGRDWHYQYVVDGTAKRIIERTGVDPDSIETALDLAEDYERRIKFQFDVQQFVDMSISSTINLPSWGSELNNEDTVLDFAATLAKYAPGLRGFTVYPDGARGGQPLTRVRYADAVGIQGQEFAEETHDICDITKSGGVCGS